MSVSVLRLADLDEVRRLAESILDAGRADPIVCVTTRHRESSPLIDAQMLAEACAPLPVHLVPTGELTWELTALLPAEFGVFGGAGRIWWPGLRPDDDPYTHPLFFAYSADEGEHAARRVLRELRQRGFAVRDAPPAVRTPAGGAATGQVTAMVYHGVDVCLQDGTPAYVPVELLGDPAPAHPRDLLTDGQWVTGRLTGRLSRDGHLVLDLRTPPVDPLVALVTGSLVEGRVVDAQRGGAEIEVAPGVCGWLALRRRDAPLVVGQVLRVRVTGIDPDTHRVLLDSAPRERPVAPTVDETAGEIDVIDPAVRLLEVQATAGELRVATASLSRQLADAREELDALKRRLADAEIDKREAIRGLREQSQQVKAELRAERDRVASLEQRLHGHGRFDDPQTQFHHEVQVAWSRATAADKAAHPLAEFTIGPSFLESLDRVHGVDRGKVTQVCGDVVSGRAPTMPGREVHALRSAAGGSPQRVRDDGAKAYRASLQQNTPSARRLHYWVLPGGAIELANVAYHDDFTIA